MLFDIDKSRICYWFAQISAIPRPSYQEKKISDFIVRFARDRGLACKQDEAFNVIIDKPASKGHEKAPALVLQGHMDMVPDKRTGSKHDFSSDPLDLYEENGLLKAKDTTLGADDGLGVAWMLAILEDDELVHPPLECIFTVQEEVGLGGALHLKPEDIHGGRLISVDCMNEGITDLCCAGGCYVNASVQLNMCANADPVYRLSVDGLKGGHSGADIEKERGNANAVIARLAEEMMQDGTDIRLIDFTCTAKANAIPRNASIRFASKTDKDILQAAFKRHVDNIRDELQSSDPDVKCVLTADGTSEKAADKSTTSSVMDFIYLSPKGFQHKSMAEQLKGLTVTSLNVGTIETKEDTIHMVWLLRSMFDSACADLSHQMEMLGKKCNVNVSAGEFFPGWQYAEKSPLRDIYAQALAEEGKQLKTIAEHGGLEVGIFARLRPGLDICTVGADCRYYHTYDEELDIASFERGYRTLCNIVRICSEQTDQQQDIKQ